MANLNPNMSPGIDVGKTFDYRQLVKGDRTLYLPVGITIDGSLSRDPLHTSYLDVLRAGMVMGKVTTGDLYAPAILGVTTAAYDASGTTTLLEVSAATAVEIARRIGTSGTFMITGPPTTTGTVAAYTAVTFSAINTTTGVITITALAADYIAGSFIQPDDGSQVPLGFINREDGLKVTDHDDANMDVAGQLLIGAVIDTSQIINVPSNAVLLAWLKGVLNAVSAGQFVFDDAYI